MVIGLDFDGTVAEHAYPNIGPESPGATDWLKKWIAAGAQIVLFTMRADGGPSGNTLTDAVEWLSARGVELYGVNRNPTQDRWTTSPKAYAHVYVDDAAFGCPLRPSTETERPVADWDVIGPAVLALIQPASPA